MSWEERKRMGQWECELTDLWKSVQEMGWFWAELGLALMP